MKTGTFVISAIVLFTLGWIGYEVYVVVHHAIVVIHNSVQS